MKLSEIKEKALIQPGIIQKQSFTNLLLFDITIMNRSIWSDESYDINEKLNGLKWSNELVHRIQNVAFELSKQEDNNAIERIFDNIEVYCKESTSLKIHLTPILKRTITNFELTKHSWSSEMNIDPRDRFIQILDRIPFNPDFINTVSSKDKFGNKSKGELEAIEQEYKSFISDWSLGNLISVGISYSYTNIQLPKVYEIVFDTKNLDRYWETKTILRYAFNHRTLFHTDLWEGHSSHCLIELIGNRPDIFDELPINDGGRTTHNGIGLCSKHDWHYIKKRA